MELLRSSFLPNDLGKFPGRHKHNYDDTLDL